MQLSPPAVFHDKYQWEIWKNTAGKSARGDREPFWHMVNMFYSQVGHQARWPFFRLIQTSETVGRYHWGLEDQDREAEGFQFKHRGRFWSEIWFKVHIPLFAIFVYFTLVINMLTCTSGSSTTSLMFSTTLRSSILCLKRMKLQQRCCRAPSNFFSCPGQLNRWPCHSLTQSVSQ